MSTRDEKRTHVRAAIVEAATQLFVDRGFEDVTMADIAAKAGVVRATVFNHFASKHALVQAITEGVFGYYEAMVARALEARDVSVPSLVYTLYVHMGEGVESAERFYGGVFREMLRTRAGFAEDEGARALRRAALRQLERLMERGQIRGELRRDREPEDLARAFDALSMATLTDWLYEEPRSDLGERMGKAATLFRGGAAAKNPKVSFVEGLVPLESTPTGPGRKRRAKRKGARR